MSLEPLSLEIVPSTGQNDTEMTVNGRGWNPGAFVTVEYHLTVGNGTGATATVLVDDRGRFTTLLAARAPTGLPGAPPGPSTGQTPSRNPEKAYELRKSGQVRPVRDVVGDNVGERAGDRYGRISEADEHLVTVADDVVDGEPNDPAQWLGVQQDQQGDDPLGQVHVGAGVDASDQCDPLFLADRGG